MTIKKITLAEGGLKGCTVIYVEPKQKGNRTLYPKHTAEEKHPIQIALERPFKDLRFHLLEICGLVNDDMEKGEIDQVVALTRVTGVKLEGDKFSIAGEKEAFADKSFKLETPLIEEGDFYEHFNSVVALLETIVEETQLYLRGEAKVTDQELVMRWIAAGKEKAIDVVAFENLPDEEQKKLATSILEKKFGAVVILEDEITSVEEGDELQSSFTANESSAKIMELPKEEEQEEEIKLSAEAEEIILPAKK
jgi:hypothetical protein